MTHYTDWESVKLKLGVPDDTIKDTMELFISDIDFHVNNELRKKLGFTDSNGNDIVLPLTATTNPALDEELKGIATDMVVGKFRQVNTENKDLWDEALSRLANYIEREFGWTSHKPFRIRSTITISPNNGPASTVVTVTGSNFVVNAVITITFSGLLPATTPTIVVSDSTGAFSATFAVPASSTIGSYIIKATDSLVNGNEKRFRVT